MKLKISYKNSFFSN